MEPFAPQPNVHLSTDVLRRGAPIRARVRWTDPSSHDRRIRSITVNDDAAAQEFFELMRASSACLVDPITLREHAHSIGDRYLRGADPTSTAGSYRDGLRLRVKPMLAHLRVRDLTTGVIDRPIDERETRLSRSLLKNLFTALTRVLDETVRDELIGHNPARDRADRRYRPTVTEPRRISFPTFEEVLRLSEACDEVQQSYADHVMLCTLLAARGAGVSRLRVVSGMGLQGLR